MPISSGAEGHVGVGVDTSIKWIPEGSAECEVLRNTNSYLQRYLQQHAVGGNIKKEKADWQSSTERQHNIQNSIQQEESTKQNLSNNNKENSRNTQNNTHNGVQKELHSTKKPVQEASKPLPSTTETKKNTYASTNGSTKKSSVCVIL